ncbi:MAG: glucose-6-phosphate dehydrogenase (NADP(+)) [Spirochaetales bacterium]|nr:glucose-6-phosphate dehydrogenase (NADP(+)) [Spirochaetales bacterium]
MRIPGSAIVILGASGDLAKRKLIPALAVIFEQENLFDSSVIIGSGRTDFNDHDFRGKFDVHGKVKDILFYHKGISGLKRYIEQKGNFSRVIFFFALPPSVYSDTAKQLFEEGFRDEARLIIEKPFGYDYESAKTINHELHEYFHESQLFRIDHYLAKEAIQNILVFRFANSIFYPVWNSRYIKEIQINASEKIGVEERGSYFDRAGIIRDMVQNHLMQLLCLLTMEAPVSLDAEDIRIQKLNVLKVLSITDCMRYQYKGYREEPGIAPDSPTETYAELVLSINNFRWYNMPVYIRAGKALNRKGTEICILFKSLPRLLFNKSGGIKPNRIVFKIQPSEGIILDLSGKIPGSDFFISETKMKFCYHDVFGDVMQEAYQKLLLDALLGDRTLFVSAEETELSWEKIGQVLDSGSIEYYEKGTMPATHPLTDWIDFEDYETACG